MDKETDFVTVAVRPKHREMIRAMAETQRRSLMDTLGIIIEEAYQAILEQRVAITPAGRHALAEESKAPAEESASA